MIIQTLEKLNPSSERLFRRRGRNEEDRLLFGAFLGSRNRLASSGFNSHHHPSPSPSRQIRFDSPPSQLCALGFFFFLFQILGSVNANSTCEKKGKIESGEREPGQWPSPLALPLAPSRVESLSPSRKKEKERNEAGWCPSRRGRTNRPQG